MKCKQIYVSDRHVGASEEEKSEQEKKFKEVGEAYGILSDAKKRARYDAGHDLDNLESSHHHSNSHNFSSSTHNMDAAQMFKAFFGQGGAAGMHHAFHHHFGFGSNASGSPNSGTFFPFG